jgi:hypothetical protein
MSYPILGMLLLTPLLLSVITVFFLDRQKRDYGVSFAAAVTVVLAIWGLIFFVL